MPVSEDLLKLLRCPESGQKLQLSQSDDGQEILVTVDGKITYPIRDGFPLLVKEEAKKVSS